MRKLLLAASFAALTFAAACDAPDGPVEEAGEEIDKALGNEPTLGDQIDETVDDAGDALKEAGEEIDQAVDDAGERMEEDTEPPSQPE
ncbi:MAG: hypothetical protein IPK75_17390 [Acidobacteria bacterium]|nr:hypothetical protein [Acidobacteriota bacterium]